MGFSFSFLYVCSVRCATVVWVSIASVIVA